MVPQFGGKWRKLRGNARSVLCFFGGDSDPPKNCARRHGFTCWCPFASKDGLVKASFRLRKWCIGHLGRNPRMTTNNVYNGFTVVRNGFLPSTVLWQYVLCLISWVEVDATILSWFGNSVATAIYFQPTIRLYIRFVPGFSHCDCHLLSANYTFVRQFRFLENYVPQKEVPSNRYACLICCLVKTPPPPFETVKFRVNEQGQ